MTENNDTYLVQDCLTGKIEAFETLVERYQKTIYNVAYRMTNNYDDAEDIAQTVFIKVYDKLNTFNPKYKFFSWLYRIAMNESMNYLNQRKRLTELDTEIIIKEETPADEYNRQETSAQLEDALMQIEPEYRILIILKHLEGFSYQEIAYCLDLPEKKVKSRLFDARRLLKNVLITRGVFLYDR